MPEPILVIEDLWRSYGEVQAVRGISLVIERGEFFGLLGPNGAGKTTTIAVISGLLQPSRGRILIHGLDLRRRPQEAKRKIGIVPQALSFYPTLSARENLSFFGRLYGLRGGPLERRIRDCLEVVHLQDRAGQHVGQFSHGMKRRLNIAIGLLHEPEILVMDEPTAGVDPQSRAEVLEGLQSMNRAGVTVLYTTHYIEEAQSLCNRVAIMDLGRVIALDAPWSLIRGLGEGIIRIRFNEPLEEPVRRELEGMGRIRVVHGSGKQVHLQVQGETDRALKGLVELQERRNLRLKTLEILEPNLETVFIHLTGRDLRD
jgi:ABC-2 type transport system ATP-binding protein